MITIKDLYEQMFEKTTIAFAVNEIPQPPIVDQKSIERICPKNPLPILQSVGMLPGAAHTRREISFENYIKYNVADLRYFGARISGELIDVQWEENCEGDKYELTRNFEGPITNIKILVNSPGATIESVTASYSDETYLLPYDITIEPNIATISDKCDKIKIIISLEEPGNVSGTMSYYNYIEENATLQVKDPDDYETFIRNSIASNTTTKVEYNEGKIFVEPISTRMDIMINEIMVSRIAENGSTTIILESEALDEPLIVNSDRRCTMALAVHGCTITMNNGSTTIIAYDKFRASLCFKGYVKKLMAGEFFTFV